MTFLLANIASKISIFLEKLLINENLIENLGSLYLTNYRVFYLSNRKDFLGNKNYSNFESVFLSDIASVKKIFSQNTNYLIKALFYLFIFFILFLIDDFSIFFNNFKGFLQILLLLLAIYNLYLWNKSKSYFLCIISFGASRIEMSIMSLPNEVVDDFVFKILEQVKITKDFHQKVE